MKIIVLGADGRLGSALNLIWTNEKPYSNIINVVKFFKRIDCDIFQPDQLERVFKNEKPDSVVNCVCFSDVDKCETEKETAQRLNAQSAEIISLMAKKYSAKLIHISTDYIFDGEKKSAYTEDDKPNPISYYGLTKLMGEEYVKMSGVDFLIIRTSRLFGPFGELDFPRRIINLTKENVELKIVHTQRGSPTYTLDLARCIFFLLAKTVSGIINVANKGDCTWFEFAQEIFKIKGIKKEIRIITVEETKRPAKRPVFSTLDLSKLEQLGYSMPHWKISLSSFLDNFL